MTPVSRTPSGRRVAVLGALPAVLLVVGVALTGCNDDGRTMRPPRPDQNASVSTTSEPPVETPGFGTEFPATLPPTLPPTVPTTAPPTTAEPTTSLDTDTTPGSTVPATLPAEGLGALTTWADGGEIPVRHTCDDVNVAPALEWTAAPEETVEIAVTMTDDDAPGYVHWAMTGIDPLSTSLAEGQIPEFALLGQNSAGELGYTGPCPPAGQTHTYVLTVHFLDAPADTVDGAPGAEMIAAIEDVTLASTAVAGIYSRA
jgi:Raf kinase inhibitor-like YbhB/YbcL family protein